MGDTAQVKSRDDYRKVRRKHNFSGGEHVTEWTAHRDLTCIDVASIRDPSRSPISYITSGGQYTMSARGETKVEGGERINSTRTFVFLVSKKGLVFQSSLVPNVILHRANERYSRMTICS
jgi:hypothetical protein